MELYEKIALVREAKKISRAEMATALNMSSQSYWNVETGKTELTVNRLTQIAEILGVSPLELLTGEPQKVEDSERVKGLEKRIEELEQSLKEVRSLNRNQEALNQLFKIQLKTSKENLDDFKSELVKSEALIQSALNAPEINLKELRELIKILFETLDLRLLITAADFAVLLNDDIVTNFEAVSFHLKNLSDMENIRIRQQTAKEKLKSL